MVKRKQEMCSGELTRYIIKQLFPHRLAEYIEVQICSNWDWFSRIEWWQSVVRLNKLRNKHWGERCFIIGNGPSLNRMNLSPLKGEVTFGLNRIFLLFDQIGFGTSYYVAVNKLVVEQSVEEILEIPCPKFISWRCRDIIPYTKDMIFLRTSGAKTFFSEDITKSLWEGATVTYVAMQVAFYLGFQQVILIGVDHSFQTQGEPGKIVVLPGDDPNHFHPQYFGKGFRWQLPNLEASELAYRIAKWKFECSGRQILDATVGGKLQVFPKVDYTTLFK